jgi:hypothetical protein
MPLNIANSLALVAQRIHFVTHEHVPSPKFIVDAKYILL